MCQKYSAYKFAVILISFFIWGCQDKVSKKKSLNVINSIKYATGFALYTYPNYTKLVIKSPYPNATKQFDYYLVKKGQEPDIKKGKIIKIPLKKVVVTSTTHIPMLTALKVEKTLVGFPNLKYISSPSVRQLIAQKKVQELGNSMQINTEILLNLKPDVLIGFSMQSQNKMYGTIEKSGIPVILNGDWLEKNPLGRAEWLKFFGALYDKNATADSLFKSLVSDYNAAKEVAQKASNKPTVLSGIMYKNIWNLPAGDSFVAQFLKDAHTRYYWQNTKGTGSLNLSFETVLNTAQNADFWIAPSNITHFRQLQESNPHYTKFKAFKTKNIYTFALTQGATGGVIYYEEAALKPNIVLKDIIKITHPDLLPNYTPYFLKKLK
jgi:cobalamin transport system substrate-binding protein